MLTAYIAGLQVLVAKECLIILALMVKTIYPIYSKCSPAMCTVSNWFIISIISINDTRYLLPGTNLKMKLNTYYLVLQSSDVDV